MTTPTPLPFDGLMLTAAVRYSLGRRSYVVSEAAGWVRRYWPSLEQGVRKTLRRDVSEALSDAADRGVHLGMGIDQRVWQDLERWMEAQGDG